MPRSLSFRYDPALEDGAQRYLAARRGQDARRPPPRAITPVAKVLTPLLRDTALTVTELEARWEAIVGATLAKLTQPEKLTGAKESRTLTLRAHAAAAPMVQHQTGLILERLRLAGSDAVKLHIRHGAAVKPIANVAPLKRKLDATEAALLDTSLASIQDDGLRAALKRLGEAVTLRQ
jgi:hypothetical protein